MKKILIVDDEEPIRKLLQTAFIPEKAITVIQAPNGDEALALAKRERPDLILLDVIMPKMHGIEMLNQLRADPWGKAVPVYLLTNYADDPRVVKAVQEGRCELISKTQCKISDVVAKVKGKLQIS